MRLAMRVSSDSLAGSRGAGMEVISLSRWIWRLVSSLIGWPSYLPAWVIQPLSTVSQRSLALAATRSESSLM
ncbi:hypothetical protein D3C71_1342050 [compost metagenome]